MSCSWEAKELLVYQKHKNCETSLLVSLLDFFIEIPVIIYLKSYFLAFDWVDIDVSRLLDFLFLSSDSLITRNYVMFWIKVQQDRNCINMIEFNLNQFEIIYSFWFLDSFMSKERKSLKFTNLFHITKLTWLTFFWCQISGRLKNL